MKEGIRKTWSIWLGNDGDDKDKDLGREGGEKERSGEKVEDGYEE